MHGEGSAHRELSTGDPACIEVPGSTGGGGWGKHPEVEHYTKVV